MRADCTYSRTGEGLHRFVDPADDRVYLYSQFEVPDARRVFTTFEQPDLKSPFTFNVTAPDALEGRLQLARPRSPSDDRRRAWPCGTSRPPSGCRPTSPRSSPASTTRSSDIYDGKHGEIPLGHYCRQSLVEHLDVEELVKLTKQGFEFFEEAFDFPYPFGKYDQLYVPEYNMGAMENAGCVTLRDEYLPRSRQDRSFYEFRCSRDPARDGAHVVRRPGHHAAGGTTSGSTSRSPSGPATTPPSRRPSSTEAWTGFTNARKNWAYRQDQLPSTHPIAADNYDLHAVEVNFDGITYAKGASRAQAARRLGRPGELPRRPAASTSRTTRSATPSSPTCSPRSRSPPAASSTAGPRSGCRPRASTPCTPSSSSTPTATTRRSRSRQTAAAGLPDAAPAPHRHRPVRRGRRPPGPPLRTSRSTSTGEQHRDRRAGRPAAARPAAAQRRRPDLRQDPPRRALAGHRRAAAWPRLDDSLARALCWGAAWDMTRDAEMTRHRLRRPGAGQHRRRDRRLRRQPDPGVRRAGGQQLLAPRPTGRRCGRPGSRACASCSRTPSRAATTS